MKKFGYLLMSLVGYFILYCSAIQWKQKDFISSLSAFLLGATFVVVFSNLLVFGKVGWIGAFLGNLTLSHVDDEPAEDP